MSFTPGRRRKKVPKMQLKDAKACDYTKNLDRFDWHEDSSYIDASLTQDESNKPIHTFVSNRKRKSHKTIAESNILSSFSLAETADESRHDKSTTLMKVLHLREIGTFGPITRHSSANRISWKEMILCKPSPLPCACHVNGPTEGDKYSQWTDYSPPIYKIQYFKNNIISMTYLKKKVWRKKHVIPFSKLRTPMMDAILAIDRTGSYLIGIGGEDLARRRDFSTNKYNPKLLLKFYGVPSPDRLHQFQQKNTESHLVSPLIHTVPLVFENDKFSEDRNMFGYNQFSSPATENPTQILFSDDELIGVAFIRHPTETCAWASRNECSKDEKALGTIVVFGMPTVSSSLSRSFHCTNVRIGGWNSFTMRNLLWPTNIIPVKETNGDENYLFRSTRKALTAWVLFNDEDDGFRMTWISNDMTSSQHKFLRKPCRISASRTDIVSLTEENVWEMKITNSETGLVHPNPEHMKQSGLNMAFELYISVDALLSDILDKRKNSSMFGKSPYQSGRVRFMPELCYNLVSVDTYLMKVTLVIVFSNKEKMIHVSKRVPLLMGVYVKLNLHDQSYDELQWACRHNDDSMEGWCKTLAINWQMKEKRIGPFCTDSTRNITETWFYRNLHENNCNGDLDDDKNATLWELYAHAKNNSTSKNEVLAPKAISMSSLFPSCDVVSNRAVQTAVPLSKLTSRNYPIEVVYG